MIDLSKYRIIDLSHELIPGELKLDGRYLYGEPLNGRPVEVQEYIGYGARMHFIQGQTHTGTHVEGAYKYSETGADMGSMPLESYLGEAVACNFTHKGAGVPITPDDFNQAGVKPGDIVLVKGSRANGMELIVNTIREVLTARQAARPMPAPGQAAEAPRLPAQEQTAQQRTQKT